jgi:hypothetical protein
MWTISLTRCRPFTLIYAPISRTRCSDSATSWTTGSYTSRFAKLRRVSGLSTWPLFMKARPGCWL